MFYATSSICFACLSEKTKRNTINLKLVNEDLLKKAMFILPDLGLNRSVCPQYACDLCRKRIIISYRFIKMCKRNYSRWTYYMTKLGRSIHSKRLSEMKVIVYKSGQPVEEQEEEPNLSSDDDEQEEIFELRNMLNRKNKKTAPGCSTQKTPQPTEKIVKNIKMLNTANVQTEEKSQNINKPDSTCTEQLQLRSENQKNIKMLSTTSVQTEEKSQNINKPDSTHTEQLQLKSENQKNIKVLSTTSIQIEEKSQNINKPDSTSSEQLQLKSKKRKMLLSCDVCQQKFYTPIALDYHLKILHKREPPAEEYLKLKTSDKHRTYSNMVSILKNPPNIASSSNIATIPSCSTIASSSNIATIASSSNIATIANSSDITTHDSNRIQRERNNQDQNHVVNKKAANVVEEAQDGTYILIVENDPAELQTDPNINFKIENVRTLPQSTPKDENKIYSKQLPNSAQNILKKYAKIAPHPNMEFIQKEFNSLLLPGEESKKIKFQITNKASTSTGIRYVPMKLFRPKKYKIKTKFIELSDTKKLKSKSKDYSNVLQILGTESIEIKNKLDVRNTTGNSIQENVNPEQNIHISETSSKLSQEEMSLNMCSSSKIEDTEYINSVFHLDTENKNKDNSNTDLKEFQGSSTETAIKSGDMEIRENLKLSSSTNIQESENMCISETNLNTENRDEGKNKEFETTSTETSSKSDNKETRKDLVLSSSTKIRESGEKNRFMCDTNLSTESKNKRNNNAKETNSKEALDFGKKIETKSMPASESNLDPKNKEIESDIEDDVHLRNVRKTYQKPKDKQSITDYNKGKDNFNKNIILNSKSHATKNLNRLNSPRPQKNIIFVHSVEHIPPGFVETNFHENNESYKKQINHVPNMQYTVPGSIINYQNINIEENNDKQLLEDGFNLEADISESINVTEDIRKREETLNGIEKEKINKKEEKTEMDKINESVIEENIEKETQISSDNKNIDNKPKQLPNKRRLDYNSDNTASSKEDIIDSDNKATEEIPENLADNILSEISPTSSAKENNEQNDKKDDSIKLKLKNKRLLYSDNRSTQEILKNVVDNNPNEIHQISTKEDNNTVEKTDSSTSKLKNKRRLLNFDNKRKEISDINTDKNTNIEKIFKFKSKPKSFGEHLHSMNSALKSIPMSTRLQMKLFTNLDEAEKLSNKLKTDNLDSDNSLPSLDCDDNLTRNKSPENNTRNDNQTKSNTLKEKSSENVNKTATETKNKMQIDEEMTTDKKQNKETHKNTNSPSDDDNHYTDKEPEDSVQISRAEITNVSDVTNNEAKSEQKTKTMSPEEDVKSEKKEKSENKFRRKPRPKCKQKNYTETTPDVENIKKESADKQNEDLQNGPEQIIIKDSGTIRRKPRPKCKQKNYEQNIVQSKTINIPTKKENIRICEICDVEFSTKLSLEDHLKTVHYLEICLSSSESESEVENVTFDEENMEIDYQEEEIEQKEATLKSIQRLFSNTDKYNSNEENKKSTESEDDIPLNSRMQNLETNEATLKSTQRLFRNNKPNEKKEDSSESEDDVSLDCRRKKLKNKKSIKQDKQGLDSYKTSLNNKRKRTNFVIKDVRSISYKRYKPRPKSKQKSKTTISQDETNFAVKENIINQEDENMKIEDNKVNTELVKEKISKTEDKYSAGSDSQKIINPKTKQENEIVETIDEAKSQTRKRGRPRNSETSSSDNEGSTSFLTNEIKNLNYDPLQKYKRKLPSNEENNISDEENKYIEKKPKLNTKERLPSNENTSFTNDNEIITKTKQDSNKNEESMEIDDQKEDIKKANVKSKSERSFTKEDKYGTSSSDTQKMTVSKTKEGSTESEKNVETDNEKDMQKFKTVKSKRSSSKDIDTQKGTVSKTKQDSNENEENVKTDDIQKETGKSNRSSSKEEKLVSNKNEENLETDGTKHIEEKKGKSKSEISSSKESSSDTQKISISKIKQDSNKNEDNTERGHRNELTEKQKDKSKQDRSSSKDDKYRTSSSKSKQDNNKKEENIDRDRETELREKKKDRPSTKEDKYGTSSSDSQRNNRNEQTEKKKSKSKQDRPSSKEDKYRSTSDIQKVVTSKTKKDNNRKEDNVERDHQKVLTEKKKEGSYSKKNKHEPSSSDNQEVTISKTKEDSNKNEETIEKDDRNELMEKTKDKSKQERASSKEDKYRTSSSDIQKVSISKTRQDSIKKEENVERDHQKKLTEKKKERSSSKEDKYNTDNTVKKIRDQVKELTEKKKDTSKQERSSIILDIEEVINSQVKQNISKNKNNIETDHQKESTEKKAKLKLKQERLSSNDDKCSISSYDSQKINLRTVQVSDKNEENVEIDRMESTEKKKAKFKLKHERLSSNNDRSSTNSYHNQKIGNPKTKQEKGSLNSEETTSLIKNKPKSKRKLLKNDDDSNSADELLNNIQDLIDDKPDTKDLKTAKQELHNTSGQSSSSSKQEKEEFEACDLCDKKFKTKLELCAHIKKKHVHECDVCSERFLTQYLLVTHLKRVHLKPKILCPVCLMEFTDTEKVTQHIKEYHNQVVLSKGKNNDAGDKVNLDPKKLRLEVEQRKKEQAIETLQKESNKQFDCKICGSQFPSTAELIVHIKSHT